MPSRGGVLVWAPQGRARQDLVRGLPGGVAMSLEDGTRAWPGRCRVLWWGGGSGRPGKLRTLPAVEGTAFTTGLLLWAQGTQGCELPALAEGHRPRGPL